MSEPTPTVYDGADLCRDRRSVFDDEAAETRSFACELPDGHDGPHRQDNVTWDQDT